MEGAAGFHCIDVLSDGDNCGACGLSCPAATTCVDGRCTCAAGLSMCGTSCVDLSEDRRNCGECGVECRTNTDCVDGACKACGGLGQACCGGTRCWEDFTTCGPSGECGKKACAEPLAPLPAEFLPRCSADTLACIEACRTNACLLDCLEADRMTPRAFDGALYGCKSCIDHQIAACLAKTSCLPGEAALYCCIEERCGGTFDSACETRCAAELDESSRCASSSDRAYILEAKEPRACFP